MRGLTARWRAWRGDHRRAVRLLRRLLVLATAAVVLLGAATVASATWVRGAAEGRLFDAADAPETPVALVLGTKVEPEAMRRWLVDRGVPAEKTVLDHAGFDTYDSCVRAYRVFGVRRATVVTQSFHLPRAVALCRDAGIDTVGVGDDTARRYADQWRISSVREYGACVKAAADVLTGRDPVHLGRRETGVDDALRA
ncbi:SanA/YdcF family protein [Micromonospora aurantiaca (nom. illeg.)]|uniref:SanA/YdcF family protein n=1 Tax=Micromonospora aurantiaca (nom. illeg.) TaxID=47850 RepID=UPI003EB77860